MAKMHISWHIIFIRLLLNHFSIFYVQFQKQKCVQELRQPKSSNTFNFKDINLWQCEVLFSYNNFSPNWLDVEKAMASHSCLENPIDVGAWWAAVHGVAKSRTEQLHFHFSLSCIGEGNGNPLQCSHLENLRDGGAWWAAVYGVTQSQTRLKRLSIA